MAKKFLTPIGLHVSPIDPATGSEGEIYFNSQTNKLRIFFDGAWNTIEGEGGGGGAGSEGIVGVDLASAWWLGA